jgi:hypothetical protein
MNADDRTSERDTRELARRLAAGNVPVRPLHRPWRRTATWVVASIPCMALVMLVVKWQGGMFWPVSSGRFGVEEASAIATALTAAGAAFASVVPGYDRRWLLLPALPLMVWLASIGVGCLQLWSFGGSATVGRDWSCVRLITLTGAGPAAMMVWMLRKGAPLMPRLSTALGGLAAAGMGNVVMRLVHPPDVSVLVLVWHVGTMSVLVAVASAVGARVLNWQSVKSLYAIKIR